MRRTLTTLLSVAVLGRAGAAASATPTFTKDVAPILFQRCASCHRPGDVAPMSLLSYTEVRPWAKSIRQKVMSREMPPWHADPRYGKFRNDRSLTQKEVDTIATWADAGAPKGNDADLPPPPKFAQGWSHGDPDYVFELPVEMEIVADGEMNVQHLWVPVPFKEDRFAQILELRPGNPGVVHHARADVASLPEGARIVNGRLVFADGSTEDGVGAAPRGRGNRSGGADSLEFARSTLISFIPGSSIEEHHLGTAKRVDAGKYIRFEVHYTPTGKPERDRTRLGVWFNQEPVTHEVLTKLSPGALQPGTPGGESTFIVEGSELGVAVDEKGVRRRASIPNIPPYAENWRIVSVTPVIEAVTVYGLLPHMHLRGQGLTWIVTWPDGREETVLDVPRYDFNWQILYQFASPLKLPAGSKITAIGRYDNSVKNRYNPAPEKEVFWSEQSWDEMFIPYMEYTIDGQDLTKKATGVQQQQ